MIQKKTVVVLILVSLVTFFILHCSKLKEGQPTQPTGGEFEAHPAGWIDTLSTNFHGKYIAAHQWNLGACQTCHGKDYTGGGAKIN